MNNRSFNEKQKYRTILRAYGISFVLTSFNVLLSSGIPEQLKGSVILAFSFTIGTAVCLVQSYLRNRRKTHRLIYELSVTSAAWFFAVALAFVIASMLVGVLSDLQEGELPRADYLFAYFPAIRGFTNQIGFVLVAVFLTSAAFAVSRRIGPKVIKNWLIGYYAIPRQEERIFMFLDMNDSTQIAERLGALKFAAALSQFFRDLSSAIEISNADISHYVGDEIIVSWPKNQRGSDHLFLTLFDRALEDINRNAARYHAEFGFGPTFKAGVHRGEVVVTEVGEIKSELVFLGDAMNTTARIIGHCGEVGQRLLVSQEVVDAMTIERERLCELGSVELKGKEEPVRLYRLV